MTTLAARAAISAEAVGEAAYDCTVAAAKPRRMFGPGESPLPDVSRATLARLDTPWCEPARPVLEGFLLGFARRLDSEGLARPPDGNRAAFERGWRENLNDLVEVRRPCLGGVCHESSVLVWRPL